MKRLVHDLTSSVGSGRLKRVVVSIGLSRVTVERNDTEANQAQFRRICKRYVSGKSLMCVVIIRELQILNSSVEFQV